MNPNHSNPKDTDTAMYEHDLISVNAEPMRTRTYVDRRAGTTSPDPTRSRHAKARSIAMRKARNGGRKGER